MSETSTRTFLVYAEDFNVFGEPIAREQTRQKVGEYSNGNEALTAAAHHVLARLKALHAQRKLSAKDLFDEWKLHGENVFIVPDDPTAPFSATDFARLMAVQLTGDTSRSLTMELTCTDCLNTSSGFSSPQKQWTFLVKAPLTYSRATTPLRRATEFMYEQMSKKAYESEGSSYTLLDLNIRELTAAEAVAAMKENPPRKVYVVQNDGSFSEAVN